MWGVTDEGMCVGVTCVGDVAPGAMLPLRKAPPPPPQLVAHVYANRVILEHWSKGDNTSFSVISYPNAIVG